MRLQNATGISAEYILNGTDEMMKDKKIKPLLEGDVPHISNTDSKIKKTGITKQFILQYEGSQQTFKLNGEASVVNLVLGNLEDSTLPFQVINHLPEFEKYNIPMTATIIVKKEYKNRDFVLYYNGEEFEIGIYNKNKIKEWNTDTLYNIKDVEVKGRIIGKYENFFLIK